MITEEQIQERADQVTVEFHREFELLRCADEGGPLARVIAKIELRIAASLASLDKCSCMCPHISAAEMVLKDGT